jgi:hypothetical protein
MWGTAAAGDDRVNMVLIPLHVVGTPGRPRIVGRPHSLAKTVTLY